MPEKSQPLIWHSLNIFRALCCRMEHERAVALGAVKLVDGRAVMDDETARSLAVFPAE